MSTTALPDPMTVRPAPHHRNARDTEVAAAQRISVKAGTLRAATIAAFQKAGDDGLTDSELAEETGKYLYSIAPRRNELLKDGWVEDAGLRRATPHGKSAAVWRLTPAGRAALAIQN